MQSMIEPLDFSAISYRRGRAASQRRSVHPSAHGQPGRRALRLHPCCRLMGRQQTAAPWSPLPATATATPPAGSERPCRQQQHRHCQQRQRRQQPARRGNSLRAVETAWANVRDTRFAGGAIGDGLHDDTAAIQAALSASQLVTVPPGRYRVTQTLHGQAGQVILGVTPERCIFTRNTTYGHTLSIGTNMSHAGSIVSCEPQILALGISLSLCCHCCLAPCLTGSCCEFLLKWPLFQ